MDGWFASVSLAFDGSRCYMACSTIAEDTDTWETGYERFQRFKLVTKTCHIRHKGDKDHKSIWSVHLIPNEEIREPEIKHIQQNKRKEFTSLSDVQETLEGGTSTRFKKMAAVLSISTGQLILL